MVVSCIYLNDSKLLNVIADKNKINIVFWLQLLKYNFYCYRQCLGNGLCLYLAETQAGFRFSQFPHFEIAGIVAFIFYS